METEKNLNDIDYCYASWKLLKDLEQYSYSRNEFIRLFHEKVNTRQSFIIGAFSMILPVILWAYVLISLGTKKPILTLEKSFSVFGTWLLGLVLVSALLFLLIFIILKVLWDSPRVQPLKRTSEIDLRRSLNSQVNHIDTKVEDILYHSILNQSMIPEPFLSTEILPLLIRYLESGQATILKEAIYALNLELKNTGHYSNLVPSKTLLQREKEYISDKEGNLWKKIEEGEKR